MQAVIQKMDGEYLGTFTQVRHKQVHMLFNVLRLTGILAIETAV